MPDFKIVSDFQTTGDQPQAVDKLVEGLTKRLQAPDAARRHRQRQDLHHGQRHRARAAPDAGHRATTRPWPPSSATEFKEFFPDNAVEYFVSYYDYYQPEAYIPRTDTYIEKDADINDEIDKLRHAATRALFERRDVLIVASVSCIYGLGEPEEYRSFVAHLQAGARPSTAAALLRRLVDMQYERNDIDFTRGKFRVRGDTLESPARLRGDWPLRIEFFGDEIERIIELDPLTGELLHELRPRRHLSRPSTSSPRRRS